MVDFQAGLPGPNAAKLVEVAPRNASELVPNQPLPMVEKIVLHLEQLREIKNVTRIHVLWMVDSPIGLLGQSVARLAVEVPRLEVVHAPIQPLQMEEKTAPSLDRKMERRNVITILVLSMEVFLIGHLGQNAAKPVVMAPILEPVHAPTQPLPMEAKIALVLVLLRRRAPAEMVLALS